jgi:hypothetical protein
MEVPLFNTISNLFETKYLNIARAYSISREFEIQTGGGILAKGTKPCCAAAAAAQVRYLIVNGDRIGISNLDGILRSAQAVAPEGELAVRKELMRLVKVYNYVPSPVEKDYEEALYAEYMKSASIDQGRS